MLSTSRRDCEAIENFQPVPYGETNIDNKCDNGVEVYRKCSSTGVWERVEYNTAKDLCSRRCGHGSS